MDIDFVMLWVDGSDKAWREEKKKYDPSVVVDADDNEERYRDWDLLRYWYRAVEKYAPWVRKIHFVTWGHVPEWLNLECPKLHFVRHEDFIPKDRLPLFNSSALEIHLHLIEDLAEHFVYFNDDVFPIRPLKPEDFFVNGLPVDMMAFQPVVANPKNPVMSLIYMNNSVLIAKHFDKRECVKAHPSHFFNFKYPPLYFCYNILEMAFPLFTGFYTMHGPSVLLKSTLEKVWSEEEEALTLAAGNRFRSKTDVTQYLFREWQKLSGNFVPGRVQQNFRYFEMSDDNKSLINTITKQKKKVICINDTGKVTESDRVRRELQEAFTSILPDKSMFEK